MRKSKVREAKCKYIRKDPEQTPCDEPSEYLLRYFRPHEDRPQWTQSCHKHLGRLVTIKMYEGASKLTVTYNKPREDTSNDNDG